jgi:hypothetical protein
MQSQTRSCAPISELKQQPAYAEPLRVSYPILPF